MASWPWYRPLKSGCVALAIVLLGSLTWFNAQPVAVGLLPSPWDRVAHFSVFFVLAGLFAFGVRKKRVWLPVVFLVGYAIFDEMRQFVLPGRTPDLGDFAVDIIGVAVGVIVSLVARRLLSIGSESQNSS